MPIYLSRTKIRWKNRKEGITEFLLQGQLKLCILKTFYVCRNCRDDPDNERDVWICHLKSPVNYLQHMNINVIFNTIHKVHLIPLFNP